MTEWPALLLEIKPYDKEAAKSGTAPLGVFSRHLAISIWSRRRRNGSSPPPGWSKTASLLRPSESSTVEAKPVVCKKDEGGPERQYAKHRLRPHRFTNQAKLKPDAS